MAKSLKKINTFWEELSPLLRKVLGDPENVGLINEIDTLVKEFSDYDWEYGPSKIERFYFCLSPGWQERYIEEIDEVISHAPKLDGWEFKSCKPRKEEILSFFILNERKEEILIQTKKWKCVMYRFKDQTVDLDVMIDEVNGDYETQYYALNIHLTNLLGERNYLKFVKNLKIVSEFSETNASLAFNINALFDHLKRLYSLFP